MKILNFKTFSLSVLISLITFTAHSVFAKPTTPPPTTVPFVDLNKYQGQWYEIAKIENSFQKKCVGGTTALYTPLANGEIQVINSCTLANGARNIAEGRARVADATTNAKLDVTFAQIFGTWIFAFSGDYWVIGLDAQYDWVIVGHPTREYGWVLARDPYLSWWEKREIKNLLVQQGYNPCDFMTTAQVGGADQSTRFCD
jgi:apolipoprotein D and lipocalin family protein